MGLSGVCLARRLGPGYLHSCAVGLSGVVFGLIVVDTAVSRAAQRSIFGFFSVPAKLYPWALLLLWQLLMPGASFLGHLSGVAVSRRLKPCSKTLGVRVVATSRHLKPCPKTLGIRVDAMGRRLRPCLKLSAYAVPR